VNKENVGQNGPDEGAKPPPDPLNERVQLVQIAAWMAERRKRTSVRDLADEIGISKSALDGMVQAFNQVREIPQPHLNWQKLKDWYLRQKHSEPGGIRDPVDMGLLALDMLSELPEAERREAARELVEAMREIFRRRKRPLPAWVVRLAQALDAEDDGGKTEG
jgi:hypothetical protein